MKVLIVATPRSGSTSLLRAISTKLKLKQYGEPWNTGIRIKKGVIEYPINEKDDFANVYKELGLLLLKEDKKEEAKENLKKYIKYAPSAKDIEIVKSYLK